MSNAFIDSFAEKLYSNGLAHDDDPLLMVSFVGRVDKNLPYGVPAKLGARGLQSCDLAPGQKVKFLAWSVQLLGEAGNNDR